MHPNETTFDPEVLRYGDGLIVGLSQDDHPSVLEQADLGADWVGFEFWLKGSASGYRSGTAGRGFERQRIAHGEQAAKAPPGGESRSFRLAIVCRTETLESRFGLCRPDAPGCSIADIDRTTDDREAHAGRLTPEMIMSLRALRAMAFTGSMRRAYVEARVTEILYDLWDCEAQARPDASASIDHRTLAKVERTLEHIDTRFAEPLAMHHLARNVGTNQAKLSRAFRTVIGQTIFEYIRRRRMEEARRMLRVDGLSVTEIALEVGYEYSCNFSVAYKRHFGISPREERATLRH